MHSVVGPVSRWGFVPATHTITLRGSTYIMKARSRSLSFSFSLVYTKWRWRSRCRRHRRRHIHVQIHVRCHERPTRTNRCPTSSSLSLCLSLYITYFISFYSYFSRCIFSPSFLLFSVVLLLLLFSSVINYIYVNFIIA